MKKLLSLLLVLFVLVGCSSAPKKEEPTPMGPEKPTEMKRTLKVDAFDGGNGQAALTALADAFTKKYPEVEVELRFEKNLDQVLSKENATGTYSDIVYYNLGQPSAYTETQLNTGEVLEITDVYSNLAMRMDDSFKNTPVGNYFGDGKQYLLPISYTPTGFFYNTELVGEGKKYALPTTWDEFFALGEQAKADGVALFTYPTAGYFDNTMLSLLVAAGGPEFLGQAFKYADGTWESEAGTLVLETIAKLVSKENGYLFADTVANANGDSYKLNQQAVIDGKALFMPNGDWVVGEMAETTPAEGFHWGLLPVPALTKGGKRVVASYTEQVFIPKQAANVADAKLFLEFLYSEEGAKIMVSNGFTVPVVGANEMLSDYAKEFFGVYNSEDVVAAIGAFAPYDAASLPDVNRSHVLFEVSINELATGTKTVAEWKTQLIDLWKTLKENPAK